MRGRRVKLDVLAEISAGERGESRAWSLRRADFEALAEVRARLDGHRAVLVTGTEDLAGTGALALAGAAAASGHRTALLECDLARPRLAATLGLAAGPGLHEYLRWEASAPQLLQPLVLAGPAAQGGPEPLVCVAAGRPAGEAATLLASESFRHATAKLREAYELIVLSAPALGGGSEALAPIAAGADALLVCLAPGQASGRPRRAARSQLRRLSVPTLGALVVGEA